MDAMATLLPSLSSDEENDNFDSEDEVEDSNEVNRDFSFGGVLVRVLVDRTFVWFGRVVEKVSSFFVISGDSLLFLREKTEGSLLV